MSNSIKDPYHIIEKRQYVEGAEFERRPTTIVLLACLEIVVSDARGSYLLVSVPQCEDVEAEPKAGKSKEAEFWTVPYLAKKVSEDSAGGYRTARTAIEAIDKAVSAWKPKSKLKAYAATLAVGVSDIKPVGSFCELKRSWTQPHVTVLYHVMRYAAVLGNCAARNLADGGSYRGFRFLPIDERYPNVTRKRKCSVHKRDETLFLSFPLASNLQAILDDEETRHEMRSRAVELSQDSFWREHTGLLFCGDLGEYGASSLYAETHMGSFSFDDHGEVLRDSATIAFTDLFMEAGVAQVHMAGDGFICALPVDRPSEARTVLNRFGKAGLRG